VKILPIVRTVVRRMAYEKPSSQSPHLPAENKENLFVGVD